MASDFDEPVKFSRKYGEFTFEGDTAMPVAPEEDASGAVEEGLSTMASGVKALMEAKRAGRIRFAPGVTATMLETMGVLLMRAAHAPNLEALSLHWRAHGLQMVDELIATVEARQGKMLMPADLASMFMGKPPGY